jgi:oxygen-independent coproporphyrinogen-3 oxidase
VIATGAAGLIDTVLSSLPSRPGVEVTVEANPDSVSSALIEALAAVGATRISLGVQTFLAEELGLLGRLHTPEDARRAAEVVVQAGLGLAIDLMCGVPNQTLDSWRETLDAALETGAEHLSVYPLALEEGTPLAVAVGSGLVPEPDPDLAADMMLLAEDVLQGAGFNRYEVANYARPGAESRHNLAYWTGEAYIGVGPSAHGMLDRDTAVAAGIVSALDVDVARVRYWNDADIDRWLYEMARETEMLTVPEAAREDLMLGLRLSRGVDRRQVEAAGAIDVVESLVGKGLLEYHAGPDGSWSTTTRGWLLGNEVFGDVWNGRQ